MLSTVHVMCGTSSCLMTFLPCCFCHISHTHIPTCRSIHECWAAVSPQLLLLVRGLLGLLPTSRALPGPGPTSRTAQLGGCWWRHRRPHQVPSASGRVCDKRGSGPGTCPPGCARHTARSWQEHCELLVVLCISVRVQKDYAKRSAQAASVKRNNQVSPSVQYDPACKDSFFPHLPYPTTHTHTHAHTSQQVAYGWVVKSVPDGNPRATATGITATVLLPPGRYTATLNAVDNTGFSTTAGPTQFVVTGNGPKGPTPLGSMSTAVMAARISSPPPIVSQGQDGQNVSINLDATGSTPSPGQQLTTYAWTVTAQLGGVPLVYFQEVVNQANAAFVSLPSGSYIVNLIVKDTAGRNSSITQVSVGRKRVREGEVGFGHC